MDGLRSRRTLPENKPAQRERRERERTGEDPRQTARARPRRGGRGRHRDAGLRTLPDPPQLPLQITRRLPSVFGILREAGPDDAIQRRRRGRLGL